MRKILLALCLCASPAAADRFDMYLGGSKLGQMVLSGDSLTIDVTGSPLGVADGSFSASSKRVQMADGRVVRQFLSDTPRKGRKISVLLDAGQVIETTVIPAEDITDLSDPAAVPAGVVDTITALNRIAAARSCLSAMSIYEGRRVITLAPTGSRSEGSTEVCDFSYRVVAGPGHLSPLYIQNANVQVTYVSGALSEMSI